MIDLSKAPALKLSEKIHVNAWDTDVYVREMTGRQLATLKKYIKIINDVPVTENELALVLVLSLVDKDGNFVFSEKDIESLNDQPLSITAPLFGKAITISGLGILGIEEAKKNLKNPKRSSTTD